MKCLPLACFCVCLSFFVHAQTKVTNFAGLTREVRQIAIGTDTIPEDVLVTGKGFNLFMQKKLSTYLSGSAEISLSRLYATYASESDKLTFGFNYAILDEETNRLKSLINPMVEMNIKDNFATLYKKGEWQSDIRVGFKFTRFFNFSTINFYGLESDKDQKSNMIRKRNAATQVILEKINKERLAFEAAANTILVTSQQLLKDSVEAKIAQLNALVALTSEQQEEKDELDTMLVHIKALTNKDPVAFDKKLTEYEDEIAKAEVAALYEKDSYTWSQTGWFSAWGFYPVTERASYIAASNTTPFAKKKFKPWEINLQGNYLREGSAGVLYASLGYKVFQNNSALADLMTKVDYNEYLQFPGTDTLNAAILESNKGYIGSYKEFVTSNINLLVVLSLNDKKKDGGEKLITPGISIRIEKNIGNYAAVNLGFGLPLRFKGKEKAVNIEPQIKLNNVNNYSDKVDFKVQPVFGINVGLPFTSLFK